MGHESLDGIGAADAHLGRRVPLPGAALPLARWVSIEAVGPAAVEVQWNLDDSRPGSPARLALYAGLTPPPERELPPAVAHGRYALRNAPLPEAQDGLRPVLELAWEHDGLFLRLTGQGPWDLAALVTLADSTG